jgi:hypothetical protein
LLGWVLAPRVVGRCKRAGIRCWFESSAYNTCLDKPTLTSPQSCRLALGCFGSCAELTAPRAPVTYPSQSKDYTASNAGITSVGFAGGTPAPYVPQVVRGQQVARFGPQKQLPRDIYPTPTWRGKLSRIDVAVLVDLNERVRFSSRSKVLWFTRPQSCQPGP